MSVTKSISKLWHHYHVAHNQVHWTRFLVSYFLISSCFEGNLAFKHMRIIGVHSVTWIHCFFKFSFFLCELAFDCIWYFNKTLMHLQIFDLWVVLTIRKAWVTFFWVVISWLVFLVTWSCVTGWCKRCWRIEMNIEKILMKEVVDNSKVEVT